MGVAMIAPKILVVPGSLRSHAADVQLAALATKELALIEAEVTRISLADYAMPLYDAEGEALAGPPLEAVKLKQMLCAHEGVLIVTPQYNASLPPVLKNAIDWIAGVRERSDAAQAAFRGRAFAIASCGGRDGGVQALTALRQVLELGCGALVIPEQTAVPDAEGAFDSAFDSMGDLADVRAGRLLKDQMRALVEMARCVSRRSV